MTPIQIANSVFNLLKKVNNNKGELGKFSKDFLDATVRWIRPLFLTNDMESKEYTEFKSDKENELADTLVKTKIQYAISNDVDLQNVFKKLLEKINKDETISKEIKNSIIGDKNVITSNSNNNTINIQ